MTTAVSSSTVDGLISGLDTSNIISKLVEADSAPQTRLKSTLTETQQKQTEYQTINSKLNLLEAAAQKLQLPTTWNGQKATSSDVSVAASATTAASAGSVSFTVNKIAAGKSVLSNDSFDSLSSTVTTAMGLPITVTVTASDGTTTRQAVTPSSGSLKDVLDGINNAANLGVKAVALRDGNGKYHLQITSTTTGAAAGDFSVTASGGKTEAGLFTTLSSASDTEIGFGTNSAVVLKSPNTTFTDLMPGLSVTVSAVSTKPVTVSVAQDTDVITSAVQSFVDTANSLLVELTAATAAGTVGTDGKTTGQGILHGDSTLRSLRSQVIDQVTSAITVGTSVSAQSFGVQTSRDGKSLVFDKDAFLKAYKAAPATVMNNLIAEPAANAADADKGKIGLATKFTNLADSSIRLMSSAIQGQKSTADDLQQRISDWNTRLASKKAYYQKYYGNLEVALGKLQSQSTWLAGQLSGLSSGG